MIDEVSLAANILAVADLIVFYFFAKSLIKLCNGDFKKQKSTKELGILVSVFAYVFYRAIYIYATLPEVRPDYWLLSIVANFFLLVAGIAFFITSKNLLKHSRVKLNA